MAIKCNSQYNHYSRVNENVLAIHLMQSDSSYCTTIPVSVAIAPSGVVNETAVELKVNELHGKCTCPLSITQPSRQYGKG